MIGFETIGNATLTVFDEEPLLTTDPWLFGNPYFGSWGHKYIIPKEQLENIKKSKFVWLSHGHPDHIDPNSFSTFVNKTILIADHYGDRIFNDLNKKFNCIKLKSNQWFEISKNIKIKNFSDWNQDSCLLVSILNKDILLNLNDGNALGWSDKIKNIINRYKNRFMLKLINWGDADMINFYDHHNDFILPLAAHQNSCGENYSYSMKKWNCNFAIPFSSFHKYIREDSVHMNKFVTPLEKHYEKFNNSHGEMLPAFIRWNSLKEDYEKIHVNENTREGLTPEEVGDKWSDDLDEDDKKIISNYFLKFYQLKKKFGFLIFKVGKSEFNLKLSNRKEGIIFNTPRKSLIAALTHNIFDDLLIGNFMKVKLVGVKSLYPDFSPYVSKYGDNGGARNKEELKNYFNYYKFQSPSFWKDFLKLKTEDIIRPILSKYKNIYFFSRKLKRLFY